ncbi:hypothetical protein M3Y99_00942400 [Aphelenchoides fujianensis]|nr:hypothetical protein M3Y99_00942400 [Aphelenchoides fujianensis]
MAERPPIAQFPSAQLCGCSKCWKNLRRRRLDPTRGHSEKAFVYEGHDLTNGIRCSAHGRYMYAFTERSELLIVDLRRNTYLVLGGQEHWIRTARQYEFVVVTLVSILVRTSSWQNSDELHLIGLHVARGNYERILLHRREVGPNFTAFVLAEIIGQQVDVTQASLHDRAPATSLVFFRLDIDEPRAFVQRELAHDEPQRAFHCIQMSNDGRQLYAIDGQTRNFLYVYSLDERKWTKETLDVGAFGDETFEVGSSSFSYELMLCTRKRRRNIERWSTFRLDIETKTWSELEIGDDRPDNVFVIKSRADGEEDGIGVVKECYNFRGYEPSFVRFKVERHMFRFPDPLKQLALLAFRTTREGAPGDAGFHALINRRPFRDSLRKHVPIEYDGMTPIPVHNLAAVPILQR